MLSVVYVFPKIKMCGKEGWAVAAGRVSLLSSYEVWPSGICPYVSTTPQKTGVREGRTRIKGEGRKQKGGWGREEYSQRGISSVNWGGTGSFRDCACRI